MTKADLIEGMATKLDLPKGQAERAVNMIFDDIVAALRNGDKVNISGFGTFAVSARKARAGRNPKTGETIQIELVEHMDQVLRKALLLEDPENYPKKLEPASEAVPPAAFQATVPPDAPDVVTH